MSSTLASKHARAADGTGGPDHARSSEKKGGCCCGCPAWVCVLFLVVIVLGGAGGGLYASGILGALGDDTDDSTTPEAIPVTLSGGFSTNSSITGSELLGSTLLKREFSAAIASAIADRLASTSRMLRSPSSPKVINGRSLQISAIEGTVDPTDVSIVSATGGGGNTPLVVGYAVSVVTRASASSAETAISNAMTTAAGTSNLLGTKLQASNVLQGRVNGPTTQTTVPGRVSPSPTAPAPSMSSSALPTPSSSGTPTATPTRTAQPSASPTNTPTSTPTPSSSPLPKHVIVHNEFIPQTFGEHKGLLYMGGKDRSGKWDVGEELFRYDPATDNFTLAFDIVPGTAHCSPRQLVSMGNYLYFVGNPAHANTDGIIHRFTPESAGTPGVAIQIASLVSTTKVFALTAYEGKLWFFTQVHTTQPHRYDPVGDSMVKLGTRSSAIGGVVLHSGCLFFKTMPSQGTFHMHKYNISSDTTTAIRHVGMSIFSDADNFVAIGQTLYFGSNGPNGDQPLGLWYYNPSTNMSGPVMDSTNSTVERSVQLVAHGTTLFAIEPIAQNKNAVTSYDTVTRVHTEEDNIHRYGHFSNGLRSISSALGKIWYSATPATAGGSVGLDGLVRLRRI